MSIQAASVVNGTKVFPLNLTFASASPLRAKVAACLTVKEKANMSATCRLWNAEPIIVKTDEGLVALRDDRVGNFSNDVLVQNLWMQNGLKRSEAVMEFLSVLNQTWANERHLRANLPAASRLQNPRYRALIKKLGNLISSKESFTSAPTLAENARSFVYTSVPIFLFMRAGFLASPVTFAGTTAYIAYYLHATAPDPELLDSDFRRITQERLQSPRELWLSRLRWIALIAACYCATRPVFSYANQEVTQLPLGSTLSYVLRMGIGGIAGLTSGFCLQVQRMRAREMWNLPRNPSDTLYPFAQKVVSWFRCCRRENQRHHDG